MKICIILGTRPEIIKMSSIIRYCESNKLDYYMIHTGQHYSYDMDKIFFEELELPLPKYNLDVGSGNHAKQTAKMLEKIDEIFDIELPEVVLVQGDTNTVLAGGLCASKRGIKVGHVEAGLRSYDRTMPEEINRIMIDHVADYLFCPTEKSKNILMEEGIEENKIFVVGNTIVDAVFQNLELSNSKVDVLSQLDLKSIKYALVTAHRPANVDNKEKLISLLNGLDNVSIETGMLVIFPVHPRTKKMIEKFELVLPESIKLTNPLGFLEFLQLEANAELILTDSGGVQEEACILKVPCVTLRENTERPETVDVGSNILAGTNSSKILESTLFMSKKRRDWNNPFGDGNAGEKIMGVLLR